jgi:glycosyltransferase involved in cell wall biosynthesis
MSNTLSAPKTVLVISQVFVPDPASVGQHIADVAFELAHRGHKVRVYASARGYENPENRYPSREILQGADVRRFGFASFGKKSMLRRIIGTAAFQIQAFFVALFTPRLAGIFFSTSPPLIGVPVSIAAFIRRVPTFYWAMDLNPDQLIALGKLKETDWVARFLELANRFILRRTTAIVALDRFMADRIAKRGIDREKIIVMPPWSHDTHIQGDEADPAENPFRARHNLAGKFVIMYSGNHSPSNPLTTLLDAVVKMKDDPDVRFLFIGGGTGKKEVEQYIRDHSLTNAISLPYQPLSELRYSLPAADVHVVSLGDEMVGIIHPCKIYGAMTVGRPILFLGPRPSHISDILETQVVGVQVEHGNLAGMLAAIKRLREVTPEERQSMGLAGQQVVQKALGERTLCAKFCDAVESALRLTPGNSC